MYLAGRIQLAYPKGSKINFLNLSVLCIALMSLSACDYFTPQQKIAKFNQKPFANTEKPQIEKTRDIAKVANAEEGFSVDNISITKDGTPKDTSMMQPTDMAALQNDIQKVKGLKTQEMFTVALSDDKKRFIRLETAVQNLTNKINAMDPAITRLMEIDRDLNNITYQLETLVNDREIATPTLPTYREARLQTAPELISPASGQTNAQIQNQANTPVKRIQNLPTNTSPNNIKNIRIGDHPNKTRIVFETSQRPEFTFDIDNMENLMMIDMGQSALSFDPKRALKKSNLINDVQQTDNSDTTKLIFALSRNTEKINQGYIKPDATHPYHRMFIDLKR